MSKQGLTNLIMLLAVFFCWTCLSPRAAHGQSIRQVLIPHEHRNAAEIKLGDVGSLVLIFRGSTRTPGPTDHSVVALDRNGRPVFNRAPKCGKDCDG